MILPLCLITGLIYYWGEYFTSLSCSSTLLYILGFHLVLNEVFHIMDLTGICEKWKYETKTKISYKDLFTGSLFNTFSMIPFYYAYDYTNSNKEIYGATYTIFEVVMCSVIYEAIFVVGHRLLHTKWLYKYHKKHHLAYGDVAITTHYMSWLDFFIEIIFPYFMGPYLISCSPVAFMIWTFVGIFNALSTHSGYNIPHLVSCEFHHTHHTNVEKNLQIDNILNYIVKQVS